MTLAELVGQVLSFIRSSRISLINYHVHTQGDVVDGVHFRFRGLVRDYEGHLNPSALVEYGGYLDLRQESFAGSDLIGGLPQIRAAWKPDE